VQVGVNTALGREALWVGNVGRAGNNSGHNALQVEKLLAQYPAGEIDAVIVLIGLNDMLWRLSFASERVYRRYLAWPGARAERVRRAFSIFPGHDQAAPWYRRSGFERFWRTVRWRSFDEGPVNEVQDEVGNVYAIWRTHRREAPEILTSLPPLDTSIDRYLRNIERIAAAARAAGARVLFASQPVMWRPDLPDELVALLWMGGIGPYMAKSGSSYYSPVALRRGMDRYNAVLRNRADSLGAELVDLAERLPRDASAFFDDAHFNENGAAEVGRIVVEHLLAHPPFDED
jgi:lysophospholipase L1-like esterase